jgi:hypothetical protein
MCTECHRTVVNIKLSNEYKVLPRFLKPMKQKWLAVITASTLQWRVYIGTSSDGSTKPNLSAVLPTQIPEPAGCPSRHIQHLCSSPAITRLLSQWHHHPPFPCFPKATDNQILDHLAPQLPLSNISRVWLPSWPLWSPPSSTVSSPTTHGLWLSSCPF